MPVKKNSVCVVLVVTCFILFYGYQHASQSLSKDEIAYVHALQLDSSSPAARWFSQIVDSDTGVRFGYQPLVVMTFLFQDQLSVEQFVPIGRFINILLHLLNGLLLFLLMQRFLTLACTQKRRDNLKTKTYGTVSLLTALLFVLHPLPLSSALELQNRVHLLLTTFLMASLLAFLFWRDRDGKPAGVSKGFRPTPLYLTMLLSLAAFLLALLTSETALILPVIIISLNLWIVKPRSQVRFILFSFLLVGLSSLYLFFRFYFLSTFGVGMMIGSLASESIPILTARQTLLPELTAVTQYATTQFVLLPYHMAKIFLPFSDWVAAAAVDSAGIGDSRLWIAWTLIALLVKFVVHGTRHKRALILFGLVLLVAGVLPFCSLFPQQRLFDDARLYVGVSGFAVLFANLLILGTKMWVDRRRRRKPLVALSLLATFVLVGFAYLALTSSKRAVRNTVDVVDYVKRHPKRGNALLLLAEKLYLEGEREAALRVLDQGVKLVREKSPTYQLMGQIYLDMQRFELALNAFNQAYIANSNNHFALMQLGFCAAKLGELKKGVALLLLVLKRRPGLAMAHFHIGRLFLEMRDMENAKQAFANALALEPRLRPAVLSFKSERLSIEGLEGKLVGGSKRRPRPLSSYLVNYRYLFYDI